MFKMKQILILGLILLSVILIGCEGVDISKVSDEDMDRISEKLIVCEEPYMRHGSDCCLDSDNNKICDDDEQNTNTNAPEETDEDVDDEELTDEKDTVDRDYEYPDCELFESSEGENICLAIEFEPMSIQENGIDTIYEGENFPIEFSISNGGNGIVWANELTAILKGPREEDMLGIPKWSITNDRDIGMDGRWQMFSFTPVDMARYTDDVTGFTDINFHIEISYNGYTKEIVRKLRIRELSTESTTE
jgi:hypothetical protein